MDLEKLKAAALAASSGPWTASKDGKPELRNQSNMIQSDCRLIAYGQLRDEDAAFVAAFNPAAALELIAQIERLNLALENEKIESQTLRHGLRLADERLRKYDQDIVKALEYARQVIDWLSEKAGCDADRIYCSRILKEGNSIDKAISSGRALIGADKGKESS